MAEELAAPAARRTASRRWSCTATWGASESARSHGRPAAALADRSGRGRGARRWARAGRVAARAAAGHRRPHRGRRRSPTTAARAGGCAASSACCRPATCGWRWRRCAATTTGAAPGPASCSTGSAAPGELRGHAVGNLLIVALWELLGDPVAGLDWVGRLLGAQGRVLPMAIGAARHRRRGRGLDPARPGRRRHGPRPGRGGDHARPGRRGARSCPSDPPACPRGRRGGRGGRLGGARPGLVVHQRDPAPAGPRTSPRRSSSTPARRLVTLNLAPQPGETAGFAPERTSRCWPRTRRAARRRRPRRPDAVGGRRRAERGVPRSGADLVVADVAARRRHAPARPATCSPRRTREIVGE